MTLESIPSLALLFPALKTLLCCGAVGSAPFALTKLLKIIRENRNLPVELLESLHAFRLRWLLGPIECRQKVLEARLKLQRLESRCQAESLVVTRPAATLLGAYERGEFKNTATVPNRPERSAHHQETGCANSLHDQHGDATI